MIRKGIPKSVIMRSPHASWKPLGKQAEPRMTAHDIVCVHTMVNSLTGADRLIRTSGVQEAIEAASVHSAGRTGGAVVAAP